jgi:WD40 repeat protein
VSRLFISHSGTDNAEAKALLDWLAEAGWRNNDVYVDFDPERGIKAGERWEKALSEAASRCEAVLFLISRAWLDAEWCREEFDLARHLNKALFGVIIARDIGIDDLPDRLKGTYQVVDLASGQDHRIFRVTLPRTHEEAHATFSEEGLSRLRDGLAKAGLDPSFLDPRSFAWPPQGDPDRPPYRGLRPLEAEDAGIFFGREAPILEALGRLLGLRSEASPRLLVVLGASGSGKSSFLRAGLLPRLARDDSNFLVLPVIRPERAALTGENGVVHALETALAAQGIARPRAEIRTAVAAGAERVQPLLRRLVDRASARTLAEASGVKGPAVVLAIDQAEELFLSDGLAEGEALLGLVRDLTREDGPAIIVLFAIRSDSYDRLATVKALEGLRQQILPLLPMPRGAYQTVIEGPALRLSETRRRLEIEPHLKQRVLRDVEEGGGSDALPLLAFTLEQLYLDYGRASDALTLADYEAFGGIKGAIEAAVERALVAADADSRIPRDPDARLALLRRGLIPWLAGIDLETGSPRRRIARLADVPAEAEPLIRLLVEHRLLAIDRVTVREGDREWREITIEPAHEALLRQWGQLRGWLQEDLGALMTLEGVKRAARDWAANAYAPDWLNHAHGRLEEAERIAARRELADDLSVDARNYLRECREREELARQQEAEVLAREEARLAEITTAQVRTARMQHRARWALAGVAVAVAIGASAVLWQQSRLDAGQFALADGQINLLAELAAVERSRGDLDGALKFSVHGARLALDRDLHRASPSPVGGELAAVVWQSDWLRVLSGHESGVYSAAFSPDGSRIVTASYDDTARIWDPASGKEIAVLRGHDAPVWSAAFSPDGRRIVTASGDETARIWDSTTGIEIAVLRGHKGPVWSAAFSPDGSRIVTASLDGTARIWDVARSNQIMVLRGHADTVNSAAFSSDGGRIVTASWDKTARMWDAASGKEIAVLRGHQEWVISATFSPDGRRVVTASWDKTARIWDTASGMEVTVLRGHESEVESATFSPDGRRVVTASWDKTARIWDAASGKEIAVLQGHETRVESAAFSPDGGRIVTASEDKTARIWDATSRGEIAVLRGPEKGFASPAFCPDGRRIVDACADSTRTWDAVSGKEMTVLRGQESESLSAASSPDAWCTFTTWDKTNKAAQIWDAASGKEIAVLRGHEGRVSHAAFSPDGRRIVTASDDNTARIWDAASGKEITVLRGHESVVISAVFSADGRRIVTASADKTARIWDAASGKEIAVLRGHEQNVVSAVFSADGRRIVTASPDNTARIWDAASGKENAVLRHEKGVYSAAFSPDGMRIVTASADKTARIWDAASGEQIAVLRGHDGDVMSAAFSPDGSRIVTSSLDKTARIWDVHFATMPTKDLITEACVNQLAGVSMLSRYEMHLAGYSDDIPPVDVCAGVE